MLNFDSFLSSLNYDNDLREETINNLQLEYECYVWVSIGLRTHHGQGVTWLEKVGTIRGWEERNCLWIELQDILELYSKLIFPLPREPNENYKMKLCDENLIDV